VRTVNIHEAKTHLSKLVDEAAKGESFIIAKAGRPMVKVVANDAPSAIKRLGFMEGEFAISDDFDKNFDEIDKDEIERLFYGSCETPP
jgi:prevent-host-death family protein